MELITNDCLLFVAHFKLITYQNLTCMTTIWNSVVDQLKPQKVLISRMWLSHWLQILISVKNIEGVWHTKQKNRDFAQTEQACRIWG